VPTIPATTWSRCAGASPRRNWSNSAPTRILTAPARTRARGDPAALDGIHIYPDPLGGDLKRALAAHHGVQPANLLLGNGSHELLMQFAQVFAGPRR
jgi:histidinol-phosphate/aromatic aminotransferase/cobyric acid decarboxylase-like protein